MKLKAAVELVILRCGYSRQFVDSIFFAIGIPMLFTWAGSLFLSLFSKFSPTSIDKGKITLSSSSPCCNLKWKYRLDFAFHGVFTSETSIENVLNVSLYKRRKCHLVTKFKIGFCLSHLIKKEWSMLSLRQYCLDFSIFPKFPYLLLKKSWTCPCTSL